MRNWKVTGKYPQFDSTGAVASTHIIITAEDRMAQSSLNQSSRT
ncbi:phage protein [Streptococcus pyogenes]|nr:phage protein [Streptococcus pyogenes]